MGDGATRVGNPSHLKLSIPEKCTGPCHATPERPALISPDDARRTIEYPMKTRGPSHLVDDKPKLTTEMDKKCRNFKNLVGRLKNGEPAKDKTDLRRNIATVNYIKEHIDKIPEDVKDVYRSARDSIVEFFVIEAGKRGHSKTIARIFIKAKLKSDPKQGIEGLHYLLKRGLDS